MKSAISSIDASLEKPAAWRWPPPPDLRAIAETSISSIDDAETHLARRCAVAARRLADQRDHLGPSTARRVVDHALGVGLGRAQLREVAPQQVGDHEPPALEHLRPLEPPARAA